MSERQWKPGDLAMVRCSDGEERRARYQPAKWGVSEEAGWLVVDGSLWLASESEARPLLVIDPEDRAQVERLLVAYLRDYDGVDAVPQAEEVDSMQTALRSLLDPPKPEEPKGLGAVVEGVDGERFVCVGTPHGAQTWQLWQSERTGQRYSYLRLANVRHIRHGLSS